MVLFTHVFGHFIIFPRSFYVILINIGQYFYTNPVLKYPVFGKNFQKYKKTTIKKKTIFLCIRPSVSNLKYHIVFFICQKNNILACILALITSLLKSREHWPKSQKQQNILFCLILVSGIMNLYVNRILDIKKIFSFDDFE